MRLKDLLKMAMENLLRRKLRTSLTVLSIVIGTVSIVLMVALELGIQENVKKEFNSFGSVNVLEVSMKKNSVKTSRFNETNIIKGLTDKDVANLQSIDGVEAVAPTILTEARLLTSQYELFVSVIGYDPAFMSIMGFKTKEGGLLRDNYHNDILFGDKALESFRKIQSDNPNAAIQRPDEFAVQASEYEMEGEYLFGDGPQIKKYPVNPLIERFKMNLNVSEDTSEGVRKVYAFNGVGIIKQGDMGKDYNVYVPIKVLDTMLKEYSESTVNVNSNGSKENAVYKTAYTTIMVKVSDMNKIKQVQKIIEAKGYSVFSLMSILDTINKTLSVLQIALGAIGGISLFVAAIGITNTMVMAITERKKEIGVMKVIGATFTDIKRLFLVESGLIGLSGGIIGILICILLSNLISTTAFSQLMSESSSSTPSFKMTIPSWLILSGLVFTTLIGIASGYLPALKAMRSSALEAIRNE